MRKLLAGLLLLALAVGVVGVAGAGADSLSFKIGYEVRRGPVGTETQIGAVDVPEGLRGHTCDVSLMSENNESEHEGNLVVVRSGDDEAWFRGPLARNGEDYRGVEYAEAAMRFEGSEPLTLGIEIVADMEFGVDEVTSSGFVVSFECVPPPTTTVPTTVAPTTTTEPPVATTVPPTTEPPSTTTVPPTTVKPPVVVVTPPTVIVVAPPAPPVQEVPTYNG